MQGGNERSQSVGVCETLLALIYASFGRAGIVSLCNNLVQIVRGATLYEANTVPIKELISSLNRGLESHFSHKCALENLTNISKRS